MRRPWNSLSEDLVNAPSVYSFENGLDMYHTAKKKRPDVLELISWALGFNQIPY